MTSLPITILLYAAFLTLGPTAVAFNGSGTADTASIRGQAVVLETGDAAAHTRIVLKDRYGVEAVAATVADADGVFRLPDVPSGTYLVEARHGVATGLTGKAELVLLSTPVPLTGGTVQLTVRFSERLAEVHREQERLRRERKGARRQGILLMREPKLPFRLIAELRQSGMGGIFDEAGHNLGRSMQIVEVAQ